MNIDIWEDRGNPHHVETISNIEFNLMTIEHVISKHRDVDIYVPDEYMEEIHDKLPQLQTEESILSDFDKWLETAELDEAKFRYEQGLISRGEEV